jgi:hypothetical protein
MYFNKSSEGSFRWLIATAGGSLTAYLLGQHYDFPSWPKPAYGESGSPGSTGTGAPDLKKLTEWLHARGANISLVQIKESKVGLQMKNLKYL